MKTNTIRERPLPRARRGEVKLRPYNCAERPNLKFVVNYRANGKRARQYFETKQKAEVFVKNKNNELQRFGAGAAGMPMELRVMASECHDELSRHGKTIRDATNFLLAHLHASERSCTAEQLVEKLTKDKKADGKSERHVRGIEQRLQRFAEAFDGRLVSEITMQEINDWLRSLTNATKAKQGAPVGPVTRNHYRAMLVQAFNFAIDNGYTTTNPALKARKADVPNDKEPGILTPEQATHLLAVADARIVPYLSIGLFAGLRRSEIELLDWSDIHFDEGLIEVKAANAKTRQRRFVTMQPNLRAWLEPHRKLNGRITPELCFREMFEAARKAARIEPWPLNALRHSFASYHLAHFSDQNVLAEQMGHRSSDMLYKHYRQLVRPKDAARYWQIMPPEQAEHKVVQMEAAR